jgi:pimeloyl-ACP methyl ester carboxylesterase
VSLGRTQTFASSGGTLAYHDAGEGAAVLLIHGFPTSSWQWRWLFPMLSTRFRVIAPDLPGYGGSVGASDEGLDPVAQTRSVRELLDHLGVERFAPVAQGTGGAVGQLLALDDPRVDALVLLDSAAFDVTLRPDGADARSVLERGTQEFVDLSGDELDGYLEPWRGPQGERAYARAAAELATDALLGREAAMAEWEFPVFLLWGEDDPFIPVEVAERLHEAIPASTLGLVPDSRHFLLDDAFATVGPMIVEYLRARYLHAPHDHEGLVMLQLEKRPAGIDVSPYGTPDPAPYVPDPAEQEVGPNA